MNKFSAIRKQLQKEIATYPKFTYLARSASAFTYVWETWYEGNTHALHIYFRVRPFSEWSTIHIATKLVDLETCGKETVYFDTEIPKAGFKSNDGFTRYDAECGTGYAKRILRGECLPVSDTLIVRKLACRYWRQFIAHYGYRHVRHRFMEENGQLFLNLD